MYSLAFITSPSKPFVYAFIFFCHPFYKNRIIVLAHTLKPALLLVS